MRIFGYLLNGFDFSCVGRCCDLQQQQIGCLNWMNKKSARHLVCHHPGVICDSGGHLLSISLSKFGFDCPFPLEAIKKLKFLRTLDLSQNRLTVRDITIANTRFMHKTN